MQRVRDSGGVPCAPAHPLGWADEEHARNSVPHDPELDASLPRLLRPRPCTGPPSTTPPSFARRPSSSDGRAHPTPQLTTSLSEGIWAEDTPWATPARLIGHDTRRSDPWPSPAPRTVPRHSAPHSSLEVHAAEARLHAERSSLWRDTPAATRRVSSASLAAPGSPLAPSPGKRTSPACVRQPSPCAEGPCADAMAPAMRWPPPKRTLYPTGTTRRAGSLQVVTDGDEAVRRSPTRSVSATLHPRHATAHPRSLSGAAWPRSAPTEPGEHANDADPAAWLARLSFSDQGPSVSEGTASVSERAPSPMSQTAPPAPGLDTRSTAFMPYLSYWSTFPYTYLPLPPPARAFVIKSFTEVDVEKSLRHDVWTSTDKGNRRLDQAWADCQHVGPIYLFFSVNGSGRFCGLAQMTSGLDYSQSTSIWAEARRWRGLFRVRWLLVKDVPNAQLRHILLTNTDEKKPVTQSRDTQELPPEATAELLHIFCTHASYSTLHLPPTLYGDPFQGP